MWGEELRVYTKVQSSLRELWLTASASDDATFLVYQDERFTFGEARAQVRRLAARLAAAGVGKGDRVAISMRNFPEWVIAFWAVQVLGAVVVSMNAWWTATEAQYGLTDSGATALITDGERYERIRGDVLDALALALVVVTRAEAGVDPGHVEWADVMAAADPGGRTASCPA